MIKSLAPDISEPTFEQMRAYIIAEGELEFERKTARFPYKLNVGLEYEEDAVDALERLAHKRYIAFPNFAIGKYKHEIHCIFFKDQADAVLFKLYFQKTEDYL
jgi:hypothetical protein